MSVIAKQTYLSLVVLAFVSMMTRESPADNGKLAIARPLTRITVDGDFTDWPSSLPRYPIVQVEVGAPSQGPSDFYASFRVGYDESALYLAVEVQDNSTVIDGTRRWETQDGCSVYLDVEHRGNGTGSIQFNHYGDDSPLFESAGPKVASSSCQRSGKFHRYEWRIDIGRLAPPATLEPGLVLGLDVSVCDRDEDGSFSWASWGPGTVKAQSSARLGDVLLVSIKQETGRVCGEFVGVTGRPHLSRHTVQLQSCTQTSPVTVTSNRRAEFDVLLPVGDYRAFTMSGKELRHFRVEGDGTSRVDFRAPSAIQRPTKAASEIVVAAGRGTRIGRLHRYGSEDGLPGGEFGGMTQAADGALWIAGRTGLSRFDGRSITVFREEGRSEPRLCHAVATDHLGHVWVGAASGLFHFDGESFVQHTHELGLPPGPVGQVIADHDGNIWIRTSSGVVRYADGSFTTIYEATSTYGLTLMAIESPSRLWLETSEGLVRLDAGDGGRLPRHWRETLIRPRAGVSGQQWTQMYAMMVDSTGRLWIGTGDGLVRYDGDSFRSWGRKDGLEHSRVLALAETEDGVLWVGTPTGLYWFRDDRFTRVEDIDSVSNLFVDREQNIWIVGRSLVRFDPRTGLRRRQSERSDGLHEANKLLQSRDGALWAGTSGDLWYFKDETVRRFASADGLSAGSVTSLLEDSRGGVWIGTGGGVTHFDGERLAALTIDDGLSASVVTALAEDSAGRIWIGTLEGITIYDPRETGHPRREERGGQDHNANPLVGHLSHLTTKDGLRSDDIYSLMVDADGAVWVGSSLGVSCWHETGVQSFDELTEVQCFLRDDSNDLWAGGEGLFRFDGTGWKQVAPAGRATVFGMTQDPAGRIWMATSVGLKVYDRFAVQTLTARDGALNSCSDVVWDDREGAVVVAGGPIVRYCPRAVPPPISVTRVATDQEYDPSTDVSLTSSQAFLHFEFRGVSFRTRPDAMLYQYRLRGYEGQWQLTGAPEVTYGALPPGDYTFEVAAIDRDLSYSETSAWVNVHVRREYGQLALWSSLGCALVAVGFLSMTVVRRNRGIRRLNVELDQRVKDRTAKLETEIAHNRKLHEQLLQAQKLEAVGTMASGIAHDFNNSLAAITGFAEAAKANSSDPGELIGHILTAARQAAGTTRNLLTFSQESLGDKGPRDLIQLVRETSAFLRKILPTSIQVSNDLPETASIWCCMDTVHIQQVLINATMNARDALPDGGEILISAGEHPDRPGFAQLVIADNGTGMPQPVLDRIFDPFFTTKSRGRGTGLGMAIVHGVIEDHEGTIEIESSVGKGTCVTIALPRCHPEPSRSKPPVPELDGRGETILVAEDNPEVRSMLETQLTSVGFRIHAVEDGLEALRVLRQQESMVRLAILDIDLPKKDGLACLREISSQFPDLPTIMMSGLSSVDPTQLATPFLRKPFDRSELLSTIRFALRRTTAEQASGVLVIDDDESVRMSTEAVLVSSNVVVFTAHDGKEAVDLLRKNLGRIGTVLLDWNIPQTEPESTLRELRRVSRSVRVLAVSGDLALQPHHVQAKGFATLLRKPIAAEALVDAVAQPKRDEGSDG